MDVNGPVVIREPLDVRCRLLELASLNKGWGEYGDELPPDRERIDRLIELYDEFGPLLRNPRIYPMTDGNLEMEWESTDILELDLDLQTLSGVLYAGDKEIDIDLNGSEGWGRLISAVNEDDA